MIKSRLMRWILLTVALAACYLPWYAQPAAALQTGVIDTAEWITLNPAARAFTPPLLASLSLRLTLGMISVALAWEATTARNTTPRIVLGMLAVVSLITFFPPFEFFTGAASDPNYRQQALVFVLALMGIVLIRLVGSPNKRYTASRAILLFLAGICGSWGWLEGASFFEAFSLPVSPGSGAVVFHIAIVLLVIQAAALWRAPESPNKKPE